MSFDWSNNSFAADYSLRSATLAPELNNWNIGATSVPTYTEQTSKPVPAPSGGFFSDALKGITATAETFLSGVQKVYQLDNQITSARLQQKQMESSLRVQELQTVGGLDLKAAQLQAQKEIGIAQAQAATGNELTRIRSSQGASIVSIPSALPTPLILALGGAVLFFAMRGKK